MSVLHLFIIFLRLGCTSFGGPVAHIGYFQHAFVDKRKWLSQNEYTELVALCQFLPGPASSQVGMAIGYKMAGQFGCLAAWLGFTLPSALLMCLLALGLVKSQAHWLDDIVQGFLIVAVVVVAQAVWGMYQKLCTTTLTKAIALITAILLIFLSSPLTQVLVLIAAGVVSIQQFAKHSDSRPVIPLSMPVESKRWMLAFVSVFIGLPLLALLNHHELVDIADISYRAGSLVFGGGHVVLPLLETEVVSAQGISEQQFLTGYGFAQGLPGPLFTFATFVGSVFAQEHPILGALVATLAIFLPGYLLLMAALPIMQMLQQHPTLRLALVGVNAAVVGILLAAFINPILVKGVTSLDEGLLACIAFYVLNNIKRPVLEIIAFVLGVVILKSWLI